LEGLERLLADAPPNVSVRRRVLAADSSGGRVLRARRRRDRRRRQRREEGDPPPQNPPRLAVVPSALSEGTVLRVRRHSLLRVCGGCRGCCCKRRAPRRRRRRRRRRLPGIPSGQSPSPSSPLPARPARQIFAEFAGGGFLPWQGRTPPFARMTLPPRANWVQFDGSVPHRYIKQCSRPTRECTSMVRARFDAYLQCTLPSRA
jgi:hypothetical protein